MPRRRCRPAPGNDLRPPTFGPRGLRLPCSWREMVGAKGPGRSGRAAPGPHVTCARVQHDDPPPAIVPAVRTAVYRRPGRCGAAGRAWRPECRRCPAGSRAIQRGTCSPGPPVPGLRRAPGQPRRRPSEEPRRRQSWRLPGRRTGQRSGLRPGRGPQRQARGPAGGRLGGAVERAPCGLPCHPRLARSRQQFVYLSSITGMLILAAGFGRWFGRFQASNAGVGL